MTHFQLICVTDCTAETVAETLGDAWRKHALQCVSYYDLTALLKPLKKLRLLSGLRDLNKKQKLRTLVEWQQILEQCLQLETVLPGSGKMHLNSLEEARMLLGGHSDALKNALHTHGRHIQFQITISWDPAAVLQAQKAHLQTLHDKPRGHHGFGEQLQTQMENYKTQQAAKFLDLLSTKATDMIQLPCDTADMVLNVVVLIPRDKEGQLDQAVEHIDQDMPGQLNIKYVGPLPSISFASLNITRTPQRAVSDACKLLNVALPSEPDMIRQAYLNCVKHHHPDTKIDESFIDTEASDVSHRLMKIKNAYQLLIRVSNTYSDVCQNIDFKSDRLFLNIQRDADIQQAA